MGVGFEPTRTTRALPVFKTGAFGRSATPPGDSPCLRYPWACRGPCQTPHGHDVPGHRRINNLQVWPRRHWLIERVWASLSRDHTECRSCAPIVVPAHPLSSNSTGWCSVSPTAPLLRRSGSEGATPRRGASLSFCRAKSAKWHLAAKIAFSPRGGSSRGPPVQIRVPYGTRI